MIFNNYLFNKIIVRNLRQFIFRKAHTAVAEVTDVEPRIKSKIQKEPFMKNVCLGIVDNEILVFPEIDSRTEHSALIHEAQDQTKAMVEEEKPFIRLLRSGIFKKELPNEFGETPCFSTHFINDLEKHDISLSTSVLLETQYSLIIKSIRNFGTEQQKNLYLKDLISGKITGAFAAYEEIAGFDLPSTQTTCTKQNSGNISYNLNGEKNWVTNGSTANIFIVLAMFEEINRKSKEFTAFIIDRNTPGVTVTKQESVSNDCDVCKVKLNNVTLHSENILGRIGDGFDVAVANLEAEKFILATSVLNVVRKLSSHATTHINNIIRSQKPVKDFELVQHKISRVIATLYALESSIYHLAGMKDLYLIDTSLESVIVQDLICTYGMNAINNCLDLLGNSRFHSSFTYKNVLEEFALFSRSFSSPENYKLFISLRALDHVGRKLSETVVKARNPFNYPGFIFKRLWYARNHANDSPKLNKNLYYNYHPSLKIIADQLEYSICRLQYCFEIMLTRHGKDIVNRQIDLVRLSNIIIDIFTVVATLARSSRSYCTGIRYCDQEVMVTTAWCQQATKRIKANVSDILGGNISFADNAFFKLAPDIFQNKGYFYVSPMEKNIK